MNYRLDLHEFRLCSNKQDGTTPYTSQIKAAAASCVNCIETAYNTAGSKAATSLP